MAVGALLRRVRDAQGKSREDLMVEIVQRTGKKLSTGAIENIETGKTTNPGILTLELIAHGLGYESYLELVQEAGTVGADKGRYQKSPARAA